MMGDFIKDLNIIDYLGIAVPGCVLVLLISGDSSGLYLWMNYFGADAPAFVKGVFLMISGYLAGMILHEIGDLMEKGAWCCPFFDPKSYAANAVGAEKICAAAEKASLLEDQTTETSADALRPLVKGIAGTLLGLVILFFATTGFCWAMKHTCECIGAFQSGAGAFFMTILIPIVGLSIFLFAGYRMYHLPEKPSLKCFVQYLCAWLKKSAAAQDSQHNLNTVRKLNPVIQTYITRNGASGKLPIFDSFRYIMRNLVICAAIVNIYSIWRPVDLYQEIGGVIARSADQTHNFFILCMFFTFFVSVAFIRYNHYAFLRYKYGYENFIAKVEENSQPNDKKQVMLSDLEVSV